MMSEKLAYEPLSSAIVQKGLQHFRSYSGICAKLNTIQKRLQEVHATRQWWIGEATRSTYGLSDFLPVFHAARLNLLSGKESWIQMYEKVPLLVRRLFFFEPQALRWIEEE